MEGKEPVFWVAEDAEYLLRAEEKPEGAGDDEERDCRPGRPGEGRTAEGDSHYESAKGAGEKDCADKVELTEAR